MNIICKPRRFGKTTELIRRASKESYGLIVCHSIDECVRIWEAALEMKENKEIKNLIPVPITYQDFLNKRYIGKNVSKIYIDDADIFIQSLSSVKIDTITVTAE